MRKVPGVLVRPTNGFRQLEAGTARPLRRRKIFVSHRRADKAVGAAHAPAEHHGACRWQLSAVPLGKGDAAPCAAGGPRPTTDPPRPLRATPPREGIFMGAAHAAVRHPKG